MSSALALPNSVITTYFGNVILLKTLVASGGWLALHTGYAGISGDPSVEMGGGDYDRQRITFGQPSGKAIVSNNDQRFTGVPISDIVELAVWDAYSGGHVLITQQLAPTIQAAKTGQLLVAAGDVGFVL